MSSSTVRLGDVLGEQGYIRGPFGSALRRPEMQTEGIPVYEQQNAIYNHRDFRFFIGEEKYEELKRFTVQPGDLVISCSGTLGKITIIREDDPVGIISQALLILRPDLEEISPDFLYYFLTSPHGQYLLLGASHGSVQTNIAKREVVSNIQIPKVSIPEQNKITKILSDLDRKIELNRRMNETLEQIGQALFKKYFVDNLESESWEKKPLNEIADVQYGFAFKSSQFNEKGEGKKIARIRNVLEGDSASYTTEEASDNYLIDNGDLLVGMDGEFHIGYWSGGEAYLVQRVANFKAKNGFSNAFVKFVITEPIQRLNKRGARTTVAHLSAKDVRDIEFPFDLVTYEKFAETFNRLYKKQASLLLEIRTLSQLRDTLLPQLISGKISV